MHLVLKYKILVVFCLMLLNITFPYSRLELTILRGSSEYQIAEYDFNVLVFVKSSKTIKLFLLTPSFLVWFSEKATSILYVLTLSMRWVTWCWNIVHVVNSAYFRYLWEKKRFFFFSSKNYYFLFQSSLYSLQILTILSQDWRTLAFPWKRMDMFSMSLIILKLKFEP